MRSEYAIAETRRLLQMVSDTVPAVINVKDKDLRYVLDDPLHGLAFSASKPQDAIGPDPPRT